MKPGVVFVRSLFFGSFAALSLGAVMCSTPAEPAKPSPAPSSAPNSTLSVAPLSAHRAPDLPPLAQPQFDVGRMPAETRLGGMSLLFQMTPAQKEQAAALQRDLEDPLSPRFKQWITPAQYAARFGASPETIAKATRWLEARGFTVHGASSFGTRLSFSGSVGQVEAAFNTEMHRYVVGGENHFAPAVQPTFPAELGPSVLGLHGVHDFRLKPAMPHPKRAPKPGTILGYPDDGGTDELLTLGPPDFAAIYDVTPLYDAHITGTGQKIAIVGESDFNDADISAFRSAFGLSTSNLPTRHLVPESGSSYFDPDTQGEAELDLEWSGSIAQDATILFVYTGNGGNLFAFDALLYAVEEDYAPIISASFAGCELGYTPNEDIFFETYGNAASMEGITVVNASGDWGAASCDADNPYETAAVYGPYVSYPSSVPSIVSVGGTEFSWGDPIPQPLVTSAVESATPFSTYWGCTGTSPSLDCTAKGYVPEMGWNELDYEVNDGPYAPYFWGASGGGPSTLFPKPYWQVGQTLPGSTRQVPDVSLSAAWAQVGYVLATSWTAADGDAQAPYPESFAPSGGTSAATPSFAAILALVNESIAEANPTAPVGLGNANPVLYAINAATKGTGAPAFHDITTGNNVVPCAPGTYGCPASPPYQYGYNAGAGYDMVTGIGSVDAYNLATAWKALVPTATALVATPSGTAEGSPIAVTATVSSKSTGATAMTGSVSFYMKTTTADAGAGVADLTLVADVPVTAATSGGDEGATATTTVYAPVGQFGQAFIVAFYGGDSHYLASWSPSAYAQTTQTLAITPSHVTLHPNQQYTFATTGGVAPVGWYIDSDTTCDQEADGGYDCSQIESLTATSGAFQAGPTTGSVTIGGFDVYGAQVFATITVSGAAVDGGTLPPAYDAGTDAAAGSTDASAGEDATAPDATSPPPDDDASGPPGDSGGGTITSSPDASSSEDSGSALPDAGAPVAPPPASGCSCVTAGKGHDAAPEGGLAGLVVVAAFAARRKRRR